MRVETIIRELYTFDELDEKAKKKARDWYRQGLYNDTFEFDHVIEDAKEVGKHLGIDIKNIYWSGFYSQGDGACFEGTYKYRKGSLKSIKSYAPMDEELHIISSELGNIQRRNGYKLVANVKHSGQYNHSGCTNIEVFHVDDNYRSVKYEQDLIDNLRSFMKWIYKQLDKTNDYINSDEYIDENIISNVYEFLKTGERA